MQLPNIFKNRRRTLLWSALIAILFFGIIGFGAAFQDEKSNTVLSVPSIWMFGLIILPIVLYYIVKYYWIRNDRYSR